MQTQLKKAGESMDRRLEHMRTEFSEIRAGRANPAVLDKVKVDYYGAPTLPISASTHRMTVRLFVLFSRLSQRTEEKKS